MLRRVIITKGARGLFYDTRDLLRVIRSTYNPLVRTAEMDILRPVMDADLLVLDDLGSEKTSEWVEETMNLIVNTRYNERRHTIFTSNYDDTPEGETETQDFTLKERIGFRIHSRLHEMCEFLEFDGADFRHAPPNAGGDDLLAMWKAKAARRPLPARTRGQAARERPDPRRSSEARRESQRHARSGLPARARAGPRGKAGAEADRPIRCSGSTSTSRSAPSICNYCNFNRGLLDTGLKDRYVAGPGGRDSVSAAGGERVDTDLLRRRHAVAPRTGRDRPHLTACREAFDVAPGAEVTLETNPETSTPDRMEGFPRPPASTASVSVSNRSEARSSRAWDACTRPPGRGRRSRRPGPPASPTSVSI